MNSTQSQSIRADLEADITPLIVNTKENGIISTTLQFPNLLKKMPENLLDMCCFINGRNSDWAKSIFFITIFIAIFSTLHKPNWRKRIWLVLLKIDLFSK